MADTVKTKLVRVSLESSFQRDGIQFWKLWLVGLTFLTAIGWWASGWLFGHSGRMRYSLGPVSTPHAPWDNHCSACHVAFAPMNHHSAAARFVADVHASDQRCESCHAGPPHHANQVEQPRLACGDCHREHRGRDASLVRLPDANCTWCHADLKSSRKTDAPAQFADAVTRFDALSHPQFGAVAKPVDRGRLRFNHQLHLAPGMSLTPNPKPNRNARMPFTVASLAPTDRDRYRAAGQSKENDAENLVRLDCSSCHRLDRSDLPTGRETVRPPRQRSVGDGMLPITYDQECKACHSIALEEPTVQRPVGLQVPHHLQPIALREYLEGQLLRRYLSDRPNALLERFLPPLAIPGKTPMGALQGKEERKAHEFLAEKLQTTEKLLYVGKQTCGECHIYDTPNGEIAVMQIPLAQAPRFQIVPTAVPQIWFPHAIFGHTAHRALECRECHAAAETSTTHADVLLPGIATCVQCHAPRQGDGIGGARFDCTECHRYHLGDDPSHGRGSLLRAPNEKQKILQWLSGAKR